MRGTTVKLYLPRALQNAVEIKPVAIETPRGHGETILVVEDDSTVRSIISDALQDLGYNVLTASDARFAIPLLQSKAAIDLLISDQAIGCRIIRPWAKITLLSDGTPI